MSSIKSITKYDVEGIYWRVDGHDGRRWMRLEVFWTEMEAQAFIEEYFPGVPQE